MSRTLTIELSDEVYAAIQHQAAKGNTSPAEVVTASLEQHFGSRQLVSQTMPMRTDAELHSARAQFERYFGAVDLGYATGVDNERIDADLAREYIARHIM